VSLRYEVVTDAARFEQASDAWNDLWRRCDGYVFQSHAWLNSWLIATGDQPDFRPLVVLAWDEHMLVGALPCAVQRRSGLRLLQWAAQRFSDYCDCLVDPTYPDAVMATLWKTLMQYGSYDLINLQQIRPGARCRPYFESLAQGHGPLQHSDRQERCMRIDNQWASGQAFFRSLNKKGRNNHTRGKRLLTELGGEVALQVVEPDEPLEEALNTALQWKLAWLRSADPTSPLLGRDYPLFKTLLTTACRTTPIKLFLLTCNGRMVAASFNFVYNQRMEAYFTAYDAAFERASPGTILIVDYAQWAFDRELRHVDFLRGEEPFKFRLSNAETVISGFDGTCTLMGRIAASGHRWLRQWRASRNHATTEVAEVEVAE